VYVYVDVCGCGCVCDMTLCMCMCVDMHADMFDYMCIVMSIAPGTGMY